LSSIDKKVHMSDTEISMELLNQHAKELGGSRSVAFIDLVEGSRPHRVTSTFYKELESSPDGIRLAMDILELIPEDPINPNWNVHCRVELAKIILRKRSTKLRQVMLIVKDNIRTRRQILDWYKTGRLT
jgi:hypothetical protein